MTVCIWHCQSLGLASSYFSNSGGDAFFFPLPRRDEEIQRLELNLARRYRCPINTPPSCRPSLP